jgi:hypothetical protein
MPLPIGVVPLAVVSGRWSCPGCLRQVHVLLRTDLPEGVAASRRTQ